MNKVVNNVLNWVLQDIKAFNLKQTSLVAVIMVFSFIGIAIFSGLGEEQELKERELKVAEVYEKYSVDSKLTVILIVISGILVIGSLLTILYLDFKNLMSSILF